MALCRTVLVASGDLRENSGCLFSFSSTIYLMVCHFLVPRLWLLLWPPQSEEFAESNPQISPLNSNIYQYDSSFSLIMGSLPQLAPLGILPVILVLREDLDTLFFFCSFPYWQFVKLNICNCSTLCCVCGRFWHTKLNKIYFVKKQTDFVL